MHRLLCLLSFILLTSFLSADDSGPHSPLFDGNVPDPTTIVPEPTPGSLVNMTAMPSSVINGSVNAISGDFFVSTTAHVVSGPDPYALGYTYSSSSLEEGTLGAGWNFYHHHYLQVYQPEGINFAREKGDFSSDDLESSCFLTEDKSLSLPDSFSAGSDVDPHCQDPFGLDPFAFEPSYSNMIAKGARKNEGGYKVHDKPPNSEKNPYTYLYLQEPSGGKLLFKGNGWARNFHLVKKKTGFTNVAGGDISGQTNIKNISVKWYSETDHWHVTFGDGTRRVYERMRKPRHKRVSYREYFYDYHLVREVKPSGNILLFSYNHDDELTLIETVSHDKTRTHSWIRFQQKSDSAFAKDPCLDIETSDKQKFTFRYKHLQKHTYSVSRIERPGLAGIDFSYSPKSSDHDKRVIKSGSDSGRFIKTWYYKNGHHAGRVKKQSAPVGENGNEAITHSYTYEKRKRGKKYHSADVRDASGALTRYYWDRFKRLAKIVKYRSNGDQLMAERFVWGKQHRAGHLKVRTLFDENNIPLLSRKFTYDSRGNVIEEILYGNFTGSTGSIKLDANGYPNSSTCDKIVTKRAYSKDGYNLKTMEMDCFGNYTYYRYKPHSNLLTAKFICDKREIKKREFFSYDKNACLIMHIVDDGSTNKRGDLKNVSERRITKIRPRLKAPHFGKPRIVEEYYVDLEKNKETLRTRTVNVHTIKGFAKEKRVYDAQNNHYCTTYYDYDDVGRVIHTKDAVGREEYFTYDNFGRVITKRGPRDHVTIYYDYDAMGRLIKQSEAHTGSFTYVTQYRYDLLGRKTAIIDPQGNQTHISYDKLNRITKIAYPIIYDDKGGIVSPSKSFEYKRLGTEVIQTDENGGKTITLFNAAGKIIFQELPDHTTIKNSYDLKGNCIKEIAPNGTEQYISYDAFDRPISITMKAGDQLLSKTAYEYNAFHLLSETGPTGEKCTYSYDYAGRKKTTCLQDTRKATYHYDSMSRLQKEESHGVVKEFAYDELGRITSEHLKNSSDKIFSYTLYDYDIDGNRSEITRSIMGEPATTKTVYDPHGRVVKETDAQGNTWKHTYNDFYVNIHKQNVTKKVTLHPTGVIEKETFDAHGNSSYLTRYDPFGVLIAQKECYYDASDNCKQIKEHSIVNGKREKTIITLFEYGPQHRLDCITEAYNTPEEKTTRFTFNSFGQKEKTIHADGSILETHYDSKGRVSRFFGSKIDYTYTYDASDRILSIYNAINNQTTTRTYDDIGNLRSETLESGLTTNYTYDPLGRIQELQLPDQSKIAYAYSPIFLESIHRLDSFDQEQWQHRILDRDLSGNILSSSLPGTAGTIAFAYDSLNRRTKISHEAFSEELIRFDPAGNLLELKFEDNIGSQLSFYNYNSLYQLTEEPDHTYAYDSLHNRTSHNNTPYQNNSLHSVLHDGKRQISYDKRGNRTSHDNTNYTYDGIDRLIEVSTPTKKTTYSYDAFDRRIEKKHYLLEENTWKLENHERYLYTLQNEIGCVDTNDNIFQLRVLGEGLGAEIGATVAMELDYYLHVPIHDHRGNVVALFASGEVVESYRYDAFGNEEISSSTPSGNPWRFSSKRVDPETGLVYFGRRYYDPSIGKWLTHDPLGLKAGPNLYAYVFNNPMTHFDPYGLFGIRDATAAIGVVAYTCFEFTVTGFTSTLALAAELARSADSIDDEPLSKWAAPVGDHFSAISNPVENVASAVRQEVFAHARSISEAISPEDIYSMTDTTLTVASAITVAGAAVKGGKALIRKVAKNSKAVMSTAQAANSGARALPAPREFPFKATSSNNPAPRNTFPAHPRDLLPQLPRDPKGHIYPADNLRIRPEQHPPKPGETYCPRHHDQHYHVETRRFPEKSWNRNEKNNTIDKVKPPEYRPGDGTGFLPGESFPGF